MQRDLPVVPLGLDATAPCRRVRSLLTGSLLHTGSVPAQTPGAAAQPAGGTDLLKGGNWVILGDGKSSCYLCNGKDHNFDACDVYIGWPREKQVPALALGHAEETSCTVPGAAVLIAALQASL